MLDGMYAFKDEWYEDDPVIAICTECGEDIHAGDTHYEIGPEDYCENCMENVFRRV